MDLYYKVRYRRTECTEGIEGIECTEGTGRTEGTGGSEREVVLSCRQNDNIIKVLLESVKEKGTGGIGVCSIELLTCHGCINMILNQLGHMDQGGCLYNENQNDN